MATTAQIAASQLNAQSSTGPRTPEGKAKSSGNAVKLGLFTIHDLVRPGQEAEHRELSAALWQDLQPEGALQEALAVEIIRATWRLQRCAHVESGLLDSVLETGLDPMQNEAAVKTQIAVDRARAQSHNILRRATGDLRRLQTERQITRETYDDGQDTPNLGLASTGEVTIALNNHDKSKLLSRKLEGLDSFEKLIVNADHLVARNFARQTQPAAA
jgi:hypothetical protein